MTKGVTKIVVALLLALLVQTTQARLACSPGSMVAASAAEICTRQLIAHECCELRQATQQLADPQEARPRPSSWPTASSAIAYDIPVATGHPRGAALAARAVSSSRAPIFLIDRSLRL